MDYAKFLIDDTYNVDYVIYRFKNKVNGKVYIGQTVKPLRKRVIQHMTNSRPTTKVHKTYFHNTLNKYGFENFDLIIVERCSSQEELNERETYWIAYYNSTDKRYGYNIDSGGQKGKSTKSLSEEHRQALLNANLGCHKSEKTK
jgi:group I intron endonuclease